jgi:hypothetical protein
MLGFGDYEQLISIPAKSVLHAAIATCLIFVFGAWLLLHECRNFILSTSCHYQTSVADYIPIIQSFYQPKTPAPKARHYVAQRVNAGEK